MPANKQPQPQQQLRRVQFSLGFVLATITLSSILFAAVSQNWLAKLIACALTMAIMAFLAAIVVDLAGWLAGRVNLGFGGRRPCRQPQGDELPQRQVPCQAEPAAQPHAARDDLPASGSLETELRQRALQLLEEIRLARDL